MERNFARKLEDSNAKILEKQAGLDWLDLENPLETHKQQASALITD